MAGRPGGPTFSCVRKNWGARQTTQPRVPARENKDSKPLTEKTVGVVEVGKTPNLTRELVGKTHRVLECTQTHPPGNQNQKGPISLWVAEEVTESQLRAEQVVLFLLGPLPHIQCHSSAKCIALPWQIPKAPPLTT